MLSSDKIRELLKQAAPHRGGIVDDFVDGTETLFVGEESLAIAHLRDRPPLTVQCWAAAGDMEEVLTVLAPQIIEWGKQHGAERLEVSMSRRGWERPLEAMGFKHYTTVYHKDV